MKLSSKDEIKIARKEIWKAYLAKRRESSQYKSELQDKKMLYQDVCMKYGISVIGEPSENGYPVYIALHGGGQGDTPDINDQQWEMMAIYYKASVKNGILINPRGIRDTWDTHANPESYIFYDRLIENIIANYPVDPNRIYLLGYSAGGDGVYMIGPRMADRFAAVHMSAGHHNNTSILNLCNTPIQLQVGINDDAYGRNEVTVEYDEKLEQLSKENGSGYQHSLFVHVMRGHNFYDNHPTQLQQVLANPSAWLRDKTRTEEVTRDTNAIHFLEQFTRNPLPNTIVWDLGNRAALRNTESFYWLQADKNLTEGIIRAKFNPEDNKVTLTMEGVKKGRISVLISEEMFDVFRPITIQTNSEVKTVTVVPDTAVIESSTVDRGDWNYQFVAKIDL